MKFGHRFGTAILAIYSVLQELILRWHLLPLNVLVQSLVIVRHVGQASSALGALEAFLGVLLVTMCVHCVAASHENNGTGTGEEI